MKTFSPQSMMTEPYRFATAKAGALTRVGRLTGPAETAGEGTSRAGLEVLDPEPGWMI